MLNWTFIHQSVPQQYQQRNKDNADIDYTKSVWSCKFSVQCLPGVTLFFPTVFFNYAFSIEVSVALPFYQYSSTLLTILEQSKFFVLDAEISFEN
jgi:hypothetical protein